MTPELAQERIAGLLRTRVYGRSLRALALTDSTNDDAKRDAASGAPDGHVVLAEAQRAGRGSHGRAWASPAGTDLYLSIVARPRLPLAALPPLTLAVGLGVAQAVDSLLDAEAGARPEVKWPNDVWIGGRKCAGILVETSSALTSSAADDPALPAAVVIGIGLNINRLQWPEELREGATSVRAMRKGAVALDRGLALAVLLLSVETWVERFVREGGETIAAALQPHLALRGARVRCGEVEGVLVGVAATGAVRIATESGVRELLAGRIVAAA